MPFLSVTVDDTVVATVDTSGRDVITVRVGGSRDDDDFADLSVTGGIYARQGVTEHRVWLDRLILTVGQTVGVALLGEATPHGDGKTLKELYPESEAHEAPTPVDREQLAAEIRQLPLVREGFTLRLVSPDGSSTNYSTAPGDHGFGFNVLWNNINPDRASVLLACYTIDSVATDKPGRTLASQKIPLHGEIQLQLVA
jgi:hypothetical protein